MSNAIFSEFRDSEFAKKQCFGFNDAFSIQNADIGLLTNDYLKFAFVENPQTKKRFIDGKCFFSLFLFTITFHSNNRNDDNTI